MRHAKCTRHPQSLKRKSKVCLDGGRDNKGSQTDLLEGMNSYMSRIQDLLTT